MMIKIIFRYHGECINILESDSANIKYYYCAACRAIDPSLKTKYRKNKENKSKKDRKGMFNFATIISYDSFVLKFYRKQYIIINRV